MSGAQKAIVTLAVLLTLSLCGNAFLAGQLAARRMAPPLFAGEQGGLMQGRAGGPGEAMRGPLRDFLRDLPPDVREPFGQALRGNREQMGQQMRGVMQARRSVMDQLKSPEFDAEALRAALAAQREAQMQMQALVHNQVVEVVAGLSPEQRTAVSGSLRKIFR